MRTPYRMTLAACTAAMRGVLGLCRFGTKHDRLNDGAGILDGWIAFIMVWAAVIITLLAIVSALLGPAE